jgi:predicted deacylase
VLDLHCDDDSLKHIFTSPELMPGLQDLSDWMGVAATLTAEDSGGGSFDEVLPTLYRKARLAHPDHPIPLGAETATLEYRGRADSFDAIGQEDAAGLFGFFAGRGLIAADAGVTPASAPAPTPFEATEVLRVDAPGLLAYRVELGECVRKGQPIADLIAMDGPEAFMARRPILSGTDGFVLSRVTGKYVVRGAGIAKIVGSEVLPARAGAYLLED